LKDEKFKAKPCDHDGDVGCVKREDEKKRRKKMKIYDI
jgi:hypothetical protein